MRRAVMAIVFGIGGYLIGALLGYALVSNLSGNSHDRDLEAATTAALVIGPCCALAAAIAGAVLGKRA